jgi:hypothetical protein
MGRANPSSVDRSQSQLFCLWEKVIRLMEASEASTSRRRMPDGEKDCTLAVRPPAPPPGC